MKLFGYNFSVRKAPARQARNYAAAKQSRMTADWLTNNLTADAVLRWSLSRMRERSRDLEQSNDHMKNFLRKLQTNVIGAQGIGMQSKVRTADGKLDKALNQAVERVYRKYCKKQNASVTCTQSLKELCRTALTTIARDGEVIIRKVRGYDNAFRYSLQLLECDHLDVNLNRALPNGNEIKMGIEFNAWGRPVNYYLLANHPGALNSTFKPQRYVVVPAEDIIHIFIKDRPSQSRGVPWAHTAIIRLRQLGAYEEAAVVNARFGASKMGFYKKTVEDATYPGEMLDAEGVPLPDPNLLLDEVEPGALEELPYGVDFTGFDPAYPNGEFPSFEKAMLRGIAAGIGCSYNSLAGDLEGVNFSSLRSGLLEERDNWRLIQWWFIENLLDAIFPEIIEMAILTGQLQYSFSRIDNLLDPRWQPRTWDWVDPLKDIQTREKELGLKVTSRTRICAEKGNDFEDIVDELAEEDALLTEKGLSADLPAETSGPGPEPDKDDDDNNDNNSPQRGRAF
jgi:lambda family phage portal protein